MTETTTNPQSYNFPSHAIAAGEKDAVWCKKFLEAMYREATTRQYSKIFFAGRDDYRKFREYALSKQSILPYKKWILGNETNDKSWVNINWSVPPIGTKYRNIVVNKLYERQFNIIATPVDPEAVDKTAKEYADLKAKMLLRQQAAQQNPELLNSPALRLNPGDPEDMDDFEMRTQLGFKTKLAMDAELGAAVIFQQNNIDQERRMVIEDEVDFGVGGYKDFLDENDMVCFRRVNPINVISSYCRRPDFGDMTWCGELIWMTLAEIAPYFSSEALKDMAENIAGKNGNPKHVPYNFAANDYDKFKVMVLDGEWLSYNTDVYKRSVNERGNYSFRRKNKTPDVAKYDIRVDVQGESKPKYLADNLQVVYKGKWVIDTNYIFDYGMATDMKRRKSQYKKTLLSYHFYAPDFYEMSALGIMERMVPLIDNYCNTYYKIQNFKNRWIPYIISINYDALENVNLGKGGAKMKPMELLDMLFQTNIMVWRNKNVISGSPDQLKPVSVELTQMANEMMTLITDMQNTVQQIRDVTGINEMVDGTGPAPRINEQAQQLALVGSNNAINQFVYADSNLLERLADSCVLRLQRVLKRKEVSGYVYSLGDNYVKFVRVSPDITLHEYAIKLQDKPDDDKRNTLMQQLNIKDSQGLIQPEDYFAIMNISNLKEMEQKLIQSSKKRQEQQQQRSLEMQQQNAQVQQQAGIAVEQAKQETQRQAHQQNMELQALKNEGLFKVESMKKESDLAGTEHTNATKVATNVLDNHVKMETAASKSDGSSKPE